MPAGRPKIELTDELREEIIHLITRGFSVRYIADKTGVSVGKFYGFQEEDEEFMEQCQRARQKSLKAMKSVAEQCVASKMECNEADAWRAAAWFLSHKHPAEYAEKRILDQSIDMKSPYEIMNAAIDQGGEPGEDD